MAPSTMLHLPIPSSTPPAEPAQPPWRVLVVDDEPEVHTITRLALRDCEFLHRGLAFIFANSAAEARAVFIAQPDVALAFIDVVMETDHAGLELVTFVRQQLGNAAVRLILRTGQPGAAPEREVIRDFDIDDYLAKTSITASKLYTATISSLRAYQRIRSLQTTQQQLERYRDGLEDLIDASDNLRETRSLKQLAQGLLQQLGGLLHGSRQSLLVQVKGASADNFEPGFDVLAQAGCREDPPEPPIDPEVLAHLSESLRRESSIHAGDVYVGYFPGGRGQVYLIYMDGVDQDDELALRLLTRFCRNIVLAFEQLHQELELLDSQSEIIFSLCGLLEARTGSCSNHERRVAHLSRLLARGLGLSALDCQTLFSISPLHDIGLAMLPSAPLHPDRPLDDAGQASWRSHPCQGADWLSRSAPPVLQAAATVALQHLEHYDGNGHPLGLHGSEIHLHARVVALAHAFDTLMHQGPQQPALPLPEVIATLKAGRGHRFDPQLVDLLLECLDEALAILHQHPDGPVTSPALASDRLAGHLQASETVK